MREPVFANEGWYPADPATLRAMVAEAMDRAVGSPPPSPARGVIAPHAGYRYSLLTACHAFRSLAGGKFTNCFVLGPSHRGDCRGKAALSGENGFQTPLGPLPVNQVLQSELHAKHPHLFQFDEAVHLQEHSLEMQLPLIRYTLGEIPIVPVVLPADSLDFLLKTGEALAESATADDVFVISTDLAHYPDLVVAEEVDRDIMEQWRSLDGSRVWETERRWQQSGRTDCGMCGVAAVTAGITALKKIFPDLAVTLVHHATSAAVSGDTSRVVGYGAAWLHGK